MSYRRFEVCLDFSMVSMAWLRHAAKIMNVPSYMPFEFEGVMTPDAHEFVALMQGDYATRQWLVRASVSSAELTNVLIEKMTGMFEGGVAEPCSVALYFAESLGLRTLVPLVAATLLRHSEAWLAFSTPALSHSNLAMSATAFVLQWGLHGSDERRSVIHHGLTKSGLRETAWNALEPSHIAEVLEHIPAVLIEVPELTSKIATQLAILHRDHAPDVCAMLGGVSAPTRTSFASVLEKNLRRTGKIRAWVACREVLKRLPQQS